MKVTREEFVKKLEELMILAEVGVEKLTYDDYDEVVVVQYDSGFTRKVNVSCDSHLAIVLDVVNRII